MDFIANINITDAFKVDNFLSMVFDMKAILIPGDKKTSTNTYLKKRIDYINNIKKAQKIIVLVPFYNVEMYIQECIDSILVQEYTNFHIYFLNDLSSDNSISLIPENKNFTIVTPNKKEHALKNIYSILLNEELFNEDDIVVLMDGDDFLLHKYVFAQLNYMYHEKKCLISYGQYVRSDGMWGHCFEFRNKDEFEEIRKLPWRTSHLKSFKYKLFKEFILQDPHAHSLKDINGCFYTSSGDVAFFIPLLEIAGYSNIFFNKEALYFYRLHNSNDNRINPSLQKEIALEVKNKDKFKNKF